ncbi:MAG TPA: RlmE family RNA methyltransferase, partial [Spirochaetia bacterium]|nr:RlmE family RNA methyltransferase [Spirochaetia bacterium]
MRKPDHYWKLSKEEGYPARSVFKLKEIQERHHPIRPASRVLDLGASPGSWSLYVLELLTGGGGVTGVDLNAPDARLASRRRYRFIQGDFTDPAVLSQIQSLGPFDVVLSDAAPSTTGTRALDTVRSLEIARQVLSICERCLNPRGSCVLKIFQGGAEREILDRMKVLFATARAFKPKAS